ncbi:uncharacterized protein LOC133038222 [Cannabis sativa]|uniref:uncharacterized protein LOC133038222 n=1 Tax=Cannabis sativa TaxID=3483 RepID=UPI0029C9DD04|nr:uncharacterized protein LOC133038222 [Cannabis sativa]
MNLRQENQTISMYYTKLKTIWEELSNYRPSCTCNGCTCGGVKKLQEHHHMEYIMSFLVGLFDNFTQIRSSILLMDPLPEANRVFHLVTQEENQKGNQNIGNDLNNANLAFAFQNDRNASSKSDSQGKKNHPPRKNRPFCTHCNIHGHTIEKCYKIHGYPPGFKNNRPKDAATNQVQANIESNPSSEESHTLLPQLNDKLHLKEIGRGSSSTGLYTLDTARSKNVLSVTADLWHSRLGHLSQKRLALLSNQLNCAVNTLHQYTPCYIFPLAKQRKLPFPNKNSFANNRFDLVHCDTWGPYHIPSHSNYKYFLTLVDDHTRFTWIYLMQQKSEVASIVPQFISYVQTQFHCTIKRFRSDNAPE